MARNQKLNQLVETKYLKDDQVDISTKLTTRTAATSSANHFVPVLLEIKCPTGATNTQSIVTTEKLFVVDIWQMNTAVGASSDTQRVNVGGVNLTDAMDVSGGAGIIKRAAALAIAVDSVAAGATINVVTTDSSGSDLPVSLVYILAYKAA